MVALRGWCVVAALSVGFCGLLGGCSSTGVAGRGEMPPVETAANVDDTDGRVILVDGAEKLVYINLSKKDRVVPGMIFECYDARVAMERGQENNSIATVEVIEVGKKSSIAFVTGAVHEIEIGDHVLMRRQR